MILSDNETKVDFGNNEPMAKTIVALLQERPHQPITVGVHGDWCTYRTPPGSEGRGARRKGRGFPTGAKQAAEPVCTSEARKIGDTLAPRDWGRAPSMSLFECQGHELTGRVFIFIAQLFLVLRVTIRSGTGQRSATVAQTSIRGLDTARTCVVAGLPRT